MIESAESNIYIFFKIFSKTNQIKQGLEKSLNLLVYTFITQNKNLYENFKNLLFFKLDRICWKITQDATKQEYWSASWFNYWK